jgi:hypothetical protein
LGEEGGQLFGAVASGLCLYHLQTGRPIGIGSKANPEAKGKTHAWVGIIVGGLFGFGYLIAVIVMIVSANSSHSFD